MSKGGGVTAAETKCVYYFPITAQTGVFYCAYSADLD